MFKLTPSIWGDFEQKEILYLEKTYSNFSCQNSNNLWHVQIKQIFLHIPGYIGRTLLSIKALSLNINFFIWKFLFCQKKKIKGCGNISKILGLGKGYDCSMLLHLMVYEMTAKSKSVILLEELAEVLYAFLCTLSLNLDLVP